MNGRSSPRVLATAARCRLPAAFPLIGAMIGLTLDPAGQARGFKVARPGFSSTRRRAWTLR